MTQTNKLQDSDKQTGMADDCFLQTRKPSVFQNHGFETKLNLYLHSLYVSQNMLMLSEPRRVPVICLLFKTSRASLLAYFLCPLLLATVITLVVDLRPSLENRFTVILLNL